MTKSKGIKRVESDSLKDLPPPEKKVVAKTLIKNGYSYRKCEEILGIDHSTVAYYVLEPVPEDLKAFSTIFDNYIRDQKHKGIGLVYKRILELVPREKRIDQVIKAGEFLEGKNNTQNTNFQQINGNAITFVTFKNESESQ